MTDSNTFAIILATILIFLTIGACAYNFYQTFMVIAPEAKAFCKSLDMEYDVLSSTNECYKIMQDTKIVSPIAYVNGRFVLVQINSYSPRP